MLPGSQECRKGSFPGASQVPMSLRQISLVAGRRRRRILGSRLHAVDHVKERLRRPAEVAGRLAGVGSLLTSPPRQNRRAGHRGQLKPVRSPDRLCLIGAAFASK